VDASERGNVARMAGAAFTEYPAGIQQFTRVVVGGAPREGKGLRLRQSATPLRITDRRGEVFPVHEYEIQVPMRGTSFGAFAEAEQFARDLTWSPEAVDSAEVLFQVPPDHFRGRRTSAGVWPGAEKVRWNASNRRRKSEYSSSVAVQTCRGKPRRRCCVRQTRWR